MRGYGLQPFAEVRREELPFALAMALYSFLVIASFWILKPLKKSLLVGFYDQTGFDLMGLQLGAAQAELLAKVLNMVVAMAAVAVFSLAASRLRRERLSLLFTGAFLVGYLVFAAVSRQPGPAVVWTFYLFGDLFATLMVAAFFAFLNDSVSADAARRLYGLVGLGGVLGGVVGSTVLSTWIDEIGIAAWLWICFALGLAIGAVVFVAARMARRLASDARPEARVQEPEPTSSGWQRTLAGARLTLRSRYLLAIAAIVGAYEIVSTIMDFQFTSTVAHYLDGDAIGAQFARVFAITNAVSVAVQFFVTPFLLTRFGVGAALLVLPASVLMGSTAFLLVPSLWIGSLLNTADNGLAYSVQQSAREALYVPTSSDEKYYAKAFIDMFVQRFAKALAVAVSLAITAWFTDFAAVSWLSLATIALVALWIAAARHAGRRFRASEEAVRQQSQGTRITRPKAARLSP